MSKLLYLAIGIFALSLNKFSKLTLKLFWFAKPLMIEADTIEKFLEDTPIPIETQTLAQIKPSLKSGDLILFVGYNEFSFFVGTKWTTRSPLNHVGIVVRDEDEIYIFEAIKEGVSLRTIDIAYSNYNAEVILVRQLTEPLNEEQEVLLKAFIPSALGKDHDFSTLSGFLEQIKGVVDIYLPHSDHDLLKNKENPNAYFCSELVAAAYIMIGVLPDETKQNYFPANEYSICDFSRYYTWPSKERLNIENMTNSLENEILILP